MVRPVALKLPDIPPPWWGWIALVSLLCLLVYGMWGIAAYLDEPERASYTDLIAQKDSTLVDVQTCQYHVNRLGARLTYMERVLRSRRR